MCCGGSSDTTSSTQTKVPDYLAAGLKTLVNQGTAAAQLPYQNYTGPRNAPFAPDQLAGFGAAEGASSAYQPWMTTAGQNLTAGTQAITPQVGGQFGTDDFNHYSNPYTAGVIDSTMSELQRQNEIQGARLDSKATLSGAFGGDRAQIEQAENARNNSQVMGQTLAGLNQANYASAEAQYNADQQRRMQALSTDRSNSLTGAQSAGNLGAYDQSLGLKGADALLGVGGQQQQQVQGNLNTAYNDFLEQRAYPGQQANLLAGILHGYPTGSTQTTTAPGPSVAGQVGGALTAGVGLLGATGAFGSNGWLGFDDGGMVPDMAMADGGGVSFGGFGGRGRHMGMGIARAWPGAHQRNGDNPPAQPGLPGATPPTVPGLNILPGLAAVAPPSGGPSTALGPPVPTSTMPAAQAAFYGPGVTGQGNPAVDALRASFATAGDHGIGLAAGGRARIHMAEGGGLNFDPGLDDSAMTNYAALPIHALVYMARQGDQIAVREMARRRQQGGLPSADRPLENAPATPLDAPGPASGAPAAEAPAGLPSAGQPAPTGLESATGPLAARFRGDITDYNPSAQTVLNAGPPTSTIATDAPGNFDIRPPSYGSGALPPVTGNFGDTIARAGHNIFTAFGAHPRSADSPSGLAGGMGAIDPDSPDATDAPTPGLAGAAAGEGGGNFPVNATPSGGIVDAGYTPPTGPADAAFAPPSPDAGPTASPDDGTPGGAGAGLTGLAAAGPPPSDPAAAANTGLRSALDAPSGAKDVPAWALPTMMAGFAMMASRSPHLLQAAGEGGIAGISYYTQQMQRDAENKRRDAQTAIENRRADTQQQHNDIMDRYYVGRNDIGQQRAGRGNWKLVFGQDKDGKPASAEFDSVTGAYRNAPPGFEPQAAGGRPNTFMLKKQSWLEVHPGDVQGALDYANGRTKQPMSPEQARVAALAIAGKMSLTGDPAEVAKNAEVFTQQILGSATAGAGAPGSASPGSGADVPLAPADPAQRVAGKTYKSPSGRYGKWTGSGWQTIAVQ